MNNSGISHLQQVAPPREEEGAHQDEGTTITRKDGEIFPVKPEFERFLDSVSNMDAPTSTSLPPIDGNNLSVVNVESSASSSSSGPMPHVIDLTTTTSRSTGYNKDGAQRSTYTHHYHNPPPASLPLPDPSRPLHYQPPRSYHQWGPPPPQQNYSQRMWGPGGTAHPHPPPTRSHHSVRGRSQPHLLLPPPRLPMPLIHYNNDPPPKVKTNLLWPVTPSPAPLPPQEQGTMPIVVEAQSTTAPKTTPFIACLKRGYESRKPSLISFASKPDPRGSVNFNPSSSQKDTTIMAPPAAPVAAAAAATTTKPRQQWEADQMKPYCHSIQHNIKHSKAQKICTWTSSPNVETMLTTAAAATTRPAATASASAATTTRRVVLWEGEDRVIGKIQRFSQGGWGKEYCLKLSDLELNVDQQGNEYWSYRFFLGGSLCFYPQFINRSDSEEIKTYILNNHMEVLRQYPIRGVMEPRLHGLLDCKKQEQQQQQQQQPQQIQQVQTVPTTTAKPTALTTCSYSYHGIKMKAVGHVSDLPTLERVSQKAALAAGIGGEDSWNIGCDVIVYRNLYDKIGWHADDTQEEECIFSIVPHSYLVRPLYFAPKGSNGRRITAAELKEGYERLKIYPAGGDAYCMDGQLQQFYVHSLPRVSAKQMKKEEMDKCRRIALIFRHGGERRLHETAPDKGVIPQTLKGTRPATAEERHPFGPMREVIREGLIYSRVYLMEKAAFSSSQGGISGTREHGCSAIVVSRQSTDCFEADDFSTLLYSSTAAQSAGALFKTYILQQNYVRVFRSTALGNIYGARDPQLQNAAYPTTTKTQKQMYRYDGLYRIADCWVLDKDQQEWYQPDSGPQGKELCTFMLKRVSVQNDGNQLSAEEHLRHCYEIGTIDCSAVECFNFKNTSPAQVPTNTQVPSKTPQPCMHPEAQPRCTKQDAGSPSNQPRLPHEYHQSCGQQQGYLPVQQQEQQQRCGQKPAVTFREAAGLIVLDSFLRS